jgi:hypothetical protein
MLGELCGGSHMPEVCQLFGREEARPIVVRVEPELEEQGGEEDPQATGSEGPPPLTSDESEGEEPERPRLCQQIVPVEANSVIHSMHKLYDWGPTMKLVRKESARRLGFWPVRTAQRFVRASKATRYSSTVATSCH